MTHVDDCASFDICPSRVALVASAARESRRIAAGLSSLEIVVSHTSQDTCFCHTRRICFYKPNVVRHGSVQAHVHMYMCTVNL